MKDAEGQGYRLPEVFLRFMRSEELQRRVPCRTACYFDAPERPGASLLLRFTNDPRWR